jgi:hypothetical protein
MWNRGRPDQGLTAGDLAVVKIVDTTNAIDNNLSLVLDPSATDGGPGGNGYFIYDMMNQAEIATWNAGATEIEVRGEDGQVTGTRPDIWAQYDNIALTPAQNFVGHKWLGAAGGNWGDATLWNAQSQPNIKGAIVSFTNAISSPQTINVEAGKQVAVINFDNLNRYTLSGVGQITMDTQTHSGYDAAHPPRSNGLAGINVLSGSHTIAVNLALGRDAIFNVVNANSTLTISGTVSSINIGSGSLAHSGQVLTKDGAGLLEMRSLLVPSINIQSGAVKILANGGPSNTSRIKSLAIAGGTDAWTSKLDLTNNDMIIDFTAPNSPLATIQNQIKSAFAGGSWNGNGIASSSAAASGVHKTALGFGEASALGITTFNGMSVTDAVLVKYTYSGDANLDGKVNALDFNALATQFGGTGKTWINGDFNYDGNVNSLDFSALSSNFNQALAAPALGSLIPEPSAIAIFALCATTIGNRRRATR